MTAVFETDAHHTMPREVFIPLLCLAGLVCGFTGKRLVVRGGDSSPSAVTAVAVPVISETPPATAVFSSQDSVESLLALEDAMLYGRLALWLPDADESSVSAFWQSYGQREKPDYKITRLVFIRWTLLNPQSAIAACGKQDPHHGWRALAINDPGAALAEVMDENRVFVYEVVSAIAEFHPSWLRAHFEQIPEDAKESALSIMRIQDDSSDPMAIMEFAQKYGHTELIGTAFRALSQKSPLAARDWILNHQELAWNSLGGPDYAIELLIQGLEPSQMIDLEQMAALEPPGQRRRMMDAIIFKNLAGTDPEAALATAIATEAPRIAANRMAEVGKNLVHSNPEKAFEVAALLFSGSPGAIDESIKVVHPNGKTTLLEGDSREMNDFIHALGTKNPSRTLEIILPTETCANKSWAVSSITGIWADRDLAGFTEWVNKQADSQVREPAARLVVRQLERMQQYGEALEWAMSLASPAESRPDATYLKWKESNPQDAQDWLNSANLPPERKLLIEKGNPK